MTHPEYDDDSKCLNCRWCEVVDFSAPSDRNWTFECRYNPPMVEGFPKIGNAWEWYCSKWEPMDKDEDEA